MPPGSLDRITLTGSQRRALNRLVRAGRTEQRLATRGQNCARRGRWTAQRAHRAVATGVEDTVRKWRHRWWSAPGLASLADAPRSGPRPTFTAMQVAQVKAMACTPPDDAGLPLSRWWCPGAGAPGHRRRRLRVDLAGHGPSVALRGRAQTLAAPIVDLHHRPGLRRQSPPRARPLRRKMGRKTVGGQRVRDLRRREDLHPGPLPLPPHAPARQGPRDAPSTTTTTAAARSPTWPPTTSTAARCSAAARTPPA